MDILEELSLAGVIPVVTVNDTADAVPIARSLMNGGLSCVEITFRTNAAADCIKQITHEFPNLVVGAGTVIDATMAKIAIDSGAQFIMSPGYSPAVIDCCKKYAIPVIPGVSNATEIQEALAAGITTLKFFPADQIGGTAMLKALSAPFPQVSFIPTGGITIQNLSEYISLPCVCAVGGSWMIPTTLIAEKNWDEITSRAATAVTTMHGFEFDHIGINSKDEADCRKSAHFFSLFGFPCHKTEASIFNEPIVEVMKSPGRGTNGHIALRCYNIERAVRYLSKFGFEVDDTSAKHDNHGLVFIYLNCEIGGFAIQLTRK